MWTHLSEIQRHEYQKMILAFASLTEMFAQKANNDNQEVLLPIINSKYQETVFQRVFNAFAEDISNTSYDVSLIIKEGTGSVRKYLVGIKTFQYCTKVQKVAQFKANLDDWASLINKIEKKSHNRTKEEINEFNKDLYRELAEKIAEVRNMRIESSEANLHGFSIDKDKDLVIPVYHVLMPARIDNSPYIYVGEAKYDKIDIPNIKIIGCTNTANPKNFTFEDGKHKYRYTSADSQLYMDFDNSNIVRDCWIVEYVDDAYSIFESIANKLQKNRTLNSCVESYSWKLEVHDFSGFNSFFAVGSKMSKKDRKRRRIEIINKYKDSLKYKDLIYLSNYLRDFFRNDIDNNKKVIIRERIKLRIEEIGNESLSKDLLKILYRSKNEVYIRIPNSYTFHKSHPHFFGNGIGEKIADPNSSKKDRSFTLVFEPSGKELECYISQTNGKAILSLRKQSYLGDWLLNKVFQLKEYEPLTVKRLEELEMNGMRLSKTDDGKIHLQFINIDSSNPPEDYLV